MGELESVMRRIGEVISGSTVPEDPDHSLNTLKWLLELDPEADAALRIAALGHDIDRAVEDRKVRRADFDDYDAFKAAHARNGAAILCEIMHECGIADDALIRDVHHLVCVHEVGGDPRSDLLKDADSLSYFDVNLPRYFEREGWEETRRRCTWGYLRLSGRASSIVASLKFRDPLGQLMNESIEAAGYLRESGETPRGKEIDLPGVAPHGSREPGGSFGRSPHRAGLESGYAGGVADIGGTDP